MPLFTPRKAALPALRRIGPRCRSRSGGRHKRLPLAYLRPMPTPDPMTHLRPTHIKGGQKAGIHHCTNGAGRPLRGSPFRPHLPVSPEAGPVGAMLATLGSFFGGGGRTAGLSVRPAVPRLPALYLEPQRLFMPGGGGAASSRHSREKRPAGAAEHAAAGWPQHGEHRAATGGHRETDSLWDSAPGRRSPSRCWS